MYSVSVRQKFIAQHFLPNETGKEHTPHSHHYFVEVCVYGERLDGQGFLIDIVDLKDILEHCIRQFSNRLLNDLNEFHAKSPTLENLANLFWVKIVSHLKSTNVSSMKVTIWEEEHLYASFEEDIVR